MITNLDAALKELEVALDPERLAAAILDATGRAAVAYDSESHGGEHRGGWRDDTGELARSYRYDVETAGRAVILTEENTADHAQHVEDRAGFSVLTAFDAGQIHAMLQQAAREAMTDRTL